MMEDPGPSMYFKAPQLSVNLTYLSEAASRRLKMYNILDTYPKADANTLKMQFRKEDLPLYSVLLGADLRDGESIEEAVKEDAVAHFILRFKFAHSYSLRMWFMRLEWRWFTVRYRYARNVSNVLSYNEIRIKTVEDVNQMIVISDKILESINGLQLEDVWASKIYEVNFAEAPYLVKTRKCILQGGRAYFVDKQMLYYLKHIFFCSLNGALKNMSCFEIDERVNHVISQLDVNIRTAMYSSLSYSIDSELREAESVTALLDGYAKSHYPLCMKLIHAMFRRDNHLRYFSRMQYGLFIKAMGVPYEAAMNFWEEGFTKKFSQDDYRRKYSYLFKHQYGMVGGRIDWSAYDCNSIISSKVSGLDQHGCPFAHYDPDKLQPKLLDLGVSRTDIDTLLQLMASKNYKTACAMYFKITHGGAEPFKLTVHPNEYFDKSKSVSGEVVLDNIPDIEDIFAPAIEEEEEEDK